MPNQIAGLPGGFDLLQHPVLPKSYHHLGC